MKEPAPRHRAVTRWRTLVLVAMAAAVLTGCDLATGTVRTATELQKAGIDNPNLNYDGGTATLDYDADPNPLEARDEQDRAARIIWENLPFQIERITVTSDGGAFPTRREYPRAVLEQAFGPRPANLDRSVEDIARRATLIAGIVGLVVLVLIVLVIVLVVRAVRRRPPAQPAPAWPQGSGGPQPWGQPGQQGWGQPVPPGQVPPGQQPWAQGPPPGQQPWGGQPGYGQPGYGTPGGYGQQQQPGSWGQTEPGTRPGSGPPSWYGGGGDGGGTPSAGTHVSGEPTTAIPQAPARPEGGDAEQTGVDQTRIIKQPGDHQPGQNGPSNNPPG